MRRRATGVLPAALGLALLLIPLTARAQTATGDVAFSVERFAPVPGAGGLFATQDAAVLGHLAMSAGGGMWVVSQPIALRDLTSGERVTTPVRTRLGGELVVAAGVLDRLQVGLGVPLVAAQSGDRLQGIDLDDEPLATTALGDIRLQAKLRLLGRAAEPGLGIALVTGLSVPTGAEDQFAGEKSVVFDWLLVASLREARWAVTVNLGQRLRHEAVVLLSPARPHDNEVVAGVGAEVVMYRGLSGIAEYVLVGGDRGPAPGVRGPSPVEARLGLRLRVTPELTVGGGYGAGTTPNEVGSPAWRLFTTITWLPK